MLLACIDDNIEQKRVYDHMLTVAPNCTYRKMKFPLRPRVHHNIDLYISIVSRSDEQNHHRSQRCVCVCVFMCVWKSLVKTFFLHIYTIYGNVRARLHRFQWTKLWILERILLVSEIWWYHHQWHREMCTFDSRIVVIVSGMCWKWNCHVYLLHCWLFMCTIILVLVLMVVILQAMAAQQRTNSH